MPRPSRCRRICFEPEYNSFAPNGAKGEERIVMTLDEFETVRLIDHEKKTHGQCSEQMGISRTTVTEIYERARAKIAECIVNGKELYISGGNYKLCDGSAWKCCGKKCSKLYDNNVPGERDEIRKEKEYMKIAVTYENGNVFPHFGHTENFKLYTVENGSVVNSEVVSTNGNGHGALAGMLTSLGVDTLICGGIGAGAQNALDAAGIKFYGGVSGSADAAVNALLQGKLFYDPNVKCNHHGEGHTCAEHKDGCGGNGSCK